MGRCGRVCHWFATPAGLRTTNGWLAIIWAGIAVPAALWFENSLPFVVFCSVWANFAGHWSAWQAARVEVKQDENGV